MLLYYVEPKITDIVKFVIPKVAAHWKTLAYFLKFDTSRVETIGKKHFRDPEKCCREVFIYWLNSKEGISPKTWGVLLRTLSDITELTAVTEQIEMDITKVANL